MAAARLDYRIPAHADAVGQLRATLVAFATELGANAAAREAIALAASEAITNVVMHAYVGIAVGEVILEACPDRHGHLLVRVCDEGIGMRPRAASPSLGLGLALIAHMTDDFRILERPGERGVIVSMRFSLDGSGSVLGDDTLAALETSKPTTTDEKWGQIRSARHGGANASRRPVDGPGAVVGRHRPCAAPPTRGASTVTRKMTAPSAASYSERRWRSTPRRLRTR